MNSRDLFLSLSGQSVSEILLEEQRGQSND